MRILSSADMQLDHLAEMEARDGQGDRLGEQARAAEERPEE